MGYGFDMPSNLFFRKTDLDRIAAIDQWLDDETGPDYKAQPLAQDLARVCKVQEEEGEAIDAFLGMTSQNPRKGKYADQNTLLSELADRALTAIYAINHFTKNPAMTAEIMENRLNRHHYRMSKFYAEQRPHP